MVNGPATTHSFPDDLHIDAILDLSFRFWAHHVQIYIVPANVHFTLQMISGNSDSSFLINEGTARKAQLIFAWPLPAAHSNILQWPQALLWLRAFQWTWSKLGILTKPEMRQFSSVLLLLFSNFPQSKWNDQNSLWCNCRHNSIDFSELWMAERTVAQGPLLTNQLRLVFSWLLSDLHVLLLAVPHKG